MSEEKKNQEKVQAMFPELNLDENNVTTLEEVEKMEKSRAEANRQAKLKEREEKRQKNYMKSMVTREEALELAQGVARETVLQLMQAQQGALRANIVHTYALIDLLIEKGLLANRDELQPYIDNVVEQVNNGELEGEEDVQTEENISPESDTNEKA